MTAMGWLREWDPFRDIGRLQREVNRLFDSQRWWPANRGADEFPRVNVESAGDDIQVLVECPGLAPEDIELSVTGDTLTVKGERKPAEGLDGGAYHRKERFAGRFVRSVELPERVASGKAEARCKDGILTVRIPRAEETRARRIAIKAS